jgi:hypothetical protein
MTTVMISGEFDARGPHMVLASRRVWHPFDPRPDEFEWLDVGLGLGRVCRFNGQLPLDGVCALGDVYTVAQHSHHAGDLLMIEHPDAPPWLRLAIHLHDGEEALSGFSDPVGPVKREPRFEAVLRPYLNAIQDAVATKAGLTGEQLRAPDVKEYDKLVYAWEDRDIRGHQPPEELAARLPGNRIEPWTHEVAFSKWMARLFALLSINGKQ